MKTKIETAVASLVIYGLLILLLSGIAYGSEPAAGGLEMVDSTQVNVEYTFEEEAYIDDIPFNTETLADAYIYQESLKVEYQFADEAYVDDIPFNTQSAISETHHTFASIK